jgi:hypothetical protein
MSEQKELKELGWCIVELMGHRRLAGEVREESLFGSAMLRLDVPNEAAGEGAFVTQFYGGASVYCITPTTEAIARGVAKSSQPAPVQRWELPAKASSGSVERLDEDEPYDDGEPDFTTDLDSRF